MARVCRVSSSSAPHGAFTAAVTITAVVGGAAELVSFVVVLGVAEVDGVVEDVDSDVPVVVVDAEAMVMVTGGGSLGSGIGGFLISSFGFRGAPLILEKRETEVERMGVNTTF